MRRPVFSVLGNANHDILEKPNVDPHEPKRVEGLGEKKFLQSLKGLGEKRL